MPQKQVWPKMTNFLLQASFTACVYHCEKFAEILPTWSVIGIDWKHRVCLVCWKNTVQITAMRCLAFKRCEQLFLCVYFLQSVGNLWRHLWGLSCFGRPGLYSIACQNCRNHVRLSRKEWQIKPISVSCRSPVLIKLWILVLVCVVSITKVGVTMWNNSAAWQMRGVLKMYG